MNWMGLTNRPYKFQVVSRAVLEATVRLEYEAPDIYPAGVKMKRVLTLPGRPKCCDRGHDDHPKGRGTRTGICLGELAFISAS